jgi:hypothetical protein
MRPYDDRDLVAEIAYVEHVATYRDFDIFEKGWDDGDIEYEFVRKTGAKNVLPDPYLSDGIYDEPLEEEALQEKVDEYLDVGSW